MEAAKDLREREKKLESVYKMLEEKWKRETIKTGKAKHNSREREEKKRSQPSKEKW